MGDGVSGRRLERECALGAKRLDLCLEYGRERLAIEVKTWRDSDKASDPMGDGLKPLDGYLARLGVSEGWLVEFDQRASAAPLRERTKRERAVTASGRSVDGIGL